MTIPLRRSDVIAVGCFVLLAFWVTAALWLHPSHGLTDNAADQAFFEWVLSHGARVLADGVNPFRDASQGYPDGVNMMANTSVLGISIPMAPVTLLLGARVSFNLAITLGLAATAIGWYAVLAGPLLRSRAAGWVGGLFCGFGPALISQSNAHLNLIGQALVPFLVWRVIVLPRHWRRGGVVLGLLAVWQYFVSAELLLLAAAGIAVALLVLVLRDRSLLRRWRPFAAGLAVAAGVAVVLLAYPLWVQFRGEGAYTQLPDGYLTMGADPLSYIGFSTQSIAGVASWAAKMSTNPTEENTFLGLPLVLALIVLTVRLRRRPLVPALAVVAVGAGICSLGPELVLLHHRHGVWLPWRVAQHLPLLSSIVPVRWGLVVTVATGLLLATAAAAAGERPGATRRVVTACLIVGLVPLFPKPLPTTRLDPPPALLAGDLPDTGSLMFVPLASNTSPDPLRWSAERRHPLQLTQGYFLGAGYDGEAIDSALERPLSRYIREIGEGLDPPVNDVLRGQARSDLAYWQVKAIVLLPTSPDVAEYRIRLTELLGAAPTRMGGTETWLVAQLPPLEPALAQPAPFTPSP